MVRPQPAQRRTRCAYGQSGHSGCTAGLNPKERTPRELRHSFVSLLSSSGVTTEEIAHLVGHGSTSVTERVYRKELRPVITRGARAINELFDGDAKR